jgi:hypothetical protein
VLGLRLARELWLFVVPRRRRREHVDVPYEQHIAHQLQPGTRRRYDRFARYQACGRLYWHGAHSGPAWARRRSPTPGIPHGPQRSSRPPAARTSWPARPTVRVTGVLLLPAAQALRASTQCLLRGELGNYQQPCGHGLGEPGGQGRLGVLLGAPPSTKGARRWRYYRAPWAGQGR